MQLFFYFSDGSLETNILTGEGKFVCHWHEEQIKFEMDRLSCNENENKASSVTLLTAELTFYKYATVRKT